VWIFRIKDEIKFTSCDAGSEKTRFGPLAPGDKEKKRISWGLKGEKKS